MGGKLPMKGTEYVQKPPPKEGEKKGEKKRRRMVEDVRGLKSG